MNEQGATNSGPATWARFETRGNVLVAAVQLAEIRDAKTAYDFRDAVLAQLERQLAVHVVFDFSAVKFIGSVGFLAFLGVRRKQPTGRIVLCNLSPQIREMFEVCRLLARDELDTAAPFEGADTLDAALATLGVH